MFDRADVTVVFQVCLTELSRTPGPESESSIDRESYSLAAGLALGMITLGQGKPYLNLLGQIVHSDFGNKLRQIRVLTQGSSPRQFSNL